MQKEFELEQLLFACGIGGRGDYIILGYTPGREIATEFSEVGTYLEDHLDTDNFPTHPGIFLWEGYVRREMSPLKDEVDVSWHGNWGTATPDEIRTHCPGLYNALFSACRSVPSVEVAESSPARYSDWEKW